MIVAIIKHLAVKNKKYKDALFYMIYKHDEETGKAILDENGKMVLRDEYYIDGINCDPYTFSDECEEIDKKFKVIKDKKSIKTHHYILSFEPEDIDKGLTGKRAQELGMEFAKEHFKGHKVMVCTHTDGHNKSKNIHCHIVVHSVRFEDIERKPYMSKYSENKAGFKHWASKDLLEYLKKAVMDMCEREGLGQVDLVTPSENKINDREYRARKSGQRKLNIENENIKSNGYEPRITQFQTLKENIRIAIKECIKKAASYDEFINLMYEQYKIKVKITRGRISFLPENRNKYIRGRALGTDYELERIKDMIANEDVIDTEKILKDYNIPLYQINAIYQRTNLKLVTNLQDNIKVKINRAYERKVKVNNLKQMALTVIYAKEHGYDSISDIDNEHKSISEKLNALKEEKKDLSNELKECNQIIRNMAIYYANKKTYKEYKASSDKDKFRSEHKIEIADYEEAYTYIKEKYPKGRLPDIKELKCKRDLLKNSVQNKKEQIKNLSNKEKEIYTVRVNMGEILNKPYDKNKERYLNKQR